MAKNKKKQRNEDKKETTLMFLHKIARNFLSIEDKRAIEVGQNLEQLIKNVGDLPPAVFEQFSAKIEKKLNEFMPQHTDALVERLEQLATKLEKVQPAQTAPIGLSGMHNTHKLDELNVEVANVKASTDELQKLQLQMKTSIDQVQQLNAAVQQTLQETKKQTDAIEIGTTDTRAKSEQLLKNLEAEMQRVTADFTRNIHSTNQLVEHLSTQLQTNGNAAVEMKQQQAKQLQAIGEQLALKVKEASDKTTNKLAQMDGGFDGLEKELNDVKKQLKSPLELLQGNINSVNKELKQLKEVTAFLEQKAKESMQLIEATEDEAYVKEATDLIAVLVDRLSVGAQLYAKHRETIEAMEQGEQEQAAWEIEKAQYTEANDKVAILTEQLKQRDKEIEQAKKQVEDEKTMAENRVAFVPIEMFQNMASKAEIELWPAAMQQMLKDEKIIPHDTYKKGELIVVNGEKLEALKEYVELATYENATLELTTTCYIHEKTRLVIQKAKSKRVQNTVAQS